MCGYCCGGTPVEKRGEGHKGCSVECYNAPTRRPSRATADLRRKAALVDEMRELTHRHVLPPVFADVLFDVGGDEPIRPGTGLET